MRIDELIAAVQGTLGLRVDGKAGPQTWGAIYDRIVDPRAAGSASTSAIAPVDASSERVIATLLPEVRQMARTLVQKAAQGGIRIKVISGLRSYQEQDALYAFGRTTPGEIVTNARAGHSHHNFGTAFDVGVFEGNRYLAASPKYRAVGVLGVDLGLEWGGNWKDFVDQPHFQLRPDWACDMSDREMLAALRERVADGLSIYA